MTARSLSPEHTAAILRALPALAALLAPELVPLVAAELQRGMVGDEGDPWIPHPRWPCASRRAAVKLAKSGELCGVRRVGKLFLVRRSELDRWIESHPVEGPVTPPTPANDAGPVTTEGDAGDDMDVVLQRHGYTRPPADVVLQRHGYTRPPAGTKSTSRPRRSR